MSDDPAGSSQQPGATPIDPVTQVKYAVGEYLSKTMSTLTQVTDELVKKNSSTEFSPLLQHLTEMMVNLMAASVKNVVGKYGGPDPSQGGGPKRPPGSGGTPYQGD